MNNDGCGDGHFGPGLNPLCNGGFDFTRMNIWLYLTHCWNRLTETV
jgi:hypothetical protein